MMKQIPIFFAIALGLVTPLSAQIQVSCRIEPGRAVLYEPVIATIRIENNTGRPVTLRDDTPGARLWMEIEQSPGRTIRQTNPFVLGAPLVVPPRETVTHRINMTQSYDMRNTGPYTVRARLDWDGQAFVSGKVFLDIVPGLEVQRLVGGVGADGSGRRQYRLLSVNRDRAEHLLLRIDDEAQGICYGVLHLGRSVRSQGIMMRLDASNNINVLHQSGPGRYVHHAFAPNGERVVRRVYTSEDPGVALVHGSDGSVIVDGASSSHMEGD